MTPPPMLGVLGGMGPLATAEFMRRVTALTPARAEPDHIPMVVWSCPQVADRVAAIQGTGPSPAPQLLGGIRTLIGAGAQAIAMPCNTAHHWEGEIRTACAAPFLSIVDAVLTAVGEQVDGGKVGVLATAATLKSGFYQRGLRDRGFDPVAPAPLDMERLVLPAIALVKGNELDAAAGLFGEAMLDLQEGGAAAIVAGCTEIAAAIAEPPAALAIPVVDSTEALAAACVRWARGSGVKQRPDAGK